MDDKSRSKLHEAFDEVHKNTPKIVKHTAEKFGKARAERQRVAIALSKARANGAKVPDASGANYVSRNDLHVMSDSTATASHVTYKEVPAMPIAEELTGSRGEINSCEAARRRNNQFRDNRTNLGRGKPSIVEICK